MRKKKMNNSIKNIVRIGVFSALAIVLGYLEQLIPLPIAFPGVKIGLSNICVLVSLYKWGWKNAFAISLIKSLVCGMLFWGVGGSIYGISGALLSFLIMTLVVKFNLLGILGVSILGAVFHNLGQLLALYIMSGSFSFIYYIAVLGISGVIMGTVTGLVCVIVIERIKKLDI